MIDPEKGGHIELCPKCKKQLEIDGSYTKYKFEYTYYQCCGRRWLEGQGTMGIIVWPKKKKSVAYDNEFGEGGE